MSDQIIFLTVVLHVLGIVHSTLLFAISEKILMTMSTQADMTTTNLNSSRATSHNVGLPQLFYVLVAKSFFLLLQYTYVYDFTGWIYVRAFHTAVKKSYFTLLNNLFYYDDVLLFSGKVHGSLARAGKVRGQTPKVCGGDFILSSCLLALCAFLVVYVYIQHTGTVAF